MTREPSDPLPLDAALDALTTLAREASPPAAPSELAQGLDGLVARLASRQERRRKLRRWSLVALPLAVCALLGLGVTWFSRGRLQAPPAAAITYRIEGGSVLEGGYLRDAGGSGIKLSFADGSRVALVPGARGRLRSLDNEGARVVIDSGTASFEVARSRNPRWFVEAGPFMVAVKGTQFTVSWEPASERFEVRLQHGRVVISGPVTGGEIALRAGQRLVVNLPKSEMVISEDQPEPAAAAPSAATPAPEPSALSAVVTPPAASASGKPVTKPRWAEQLASGHWDSILEEVERRGVEASLASASSEDLFALADAARYRRRSDLARSALLAQRRRFPGSPRSLDAVFLLGRVEELRAGGATEALARYDE
ncbi:MAG TPA: FecR domain-containing protein, partial [Polyangiaceae bacterium]|nr:FecR domain-containing protein [Polyangiaceae bacterium]